MLNLVAIDAKIAKFLSREVPIHYSCSTCLTFSFFFPVSIRAQVPPIQDILHHGFPMCGRRGRTKLAVPSSERSSMTKRVSNQLYVSGLENVQGSTGLVLPGSAQKFYSRTWCQTTSSIEDRESTHTLTGLTGLYIFSPKSRQAAFHINPELSISKTAEPRPAVVLCTTSSSQRPQPYGLNSDLQILWEVRAFAWSPCLKSPNAIES